jgi:hypothetical protein
MNSNLLRFIFIAGLIVLSGILYLVQYLVFHDTRDMAFYFLQDIAFLPLQVLLVTLILERVLRSVEKQERIEKQNMVIGTFFSQFGVALLKRLSTRDPSMESIRAELVIGNTWTDEKFRSLSSQLAGYRSGLKTGDIDFNELKQIMGSERGFLLGLLENQNLLEHEEFTELLWATFHLLEELTYRQDLSRLPKSDLDHLVGDMNRAYVLLICQWIVYMRHLKNNYPYLFSFALRTNPFDKDAAIVVQ